MPKKPKRSRSAFDFKRGNSWFGPPEDLILIGLDTDDGPEHPLYKEDIHKPLDEHFVQNVDEYGVIQPISVRKNGERAEVTWGRTRVRAAREVNRRRAKRGDPPLLVELTLKKAEEKVLHAMSVAENAARKKFSAVEEAREMQKLMRSGYDEDDVAKAFACSVAKVKNRLALLTLSPKLIASIESDKITHTLALELKSYSHEQQEQMLDEIRGDVTVERVRDPDDPFVPATMTEEPSKNGKRSRSTGQAVKAALGKRVLPNKKQLKAMIEHGSLAEATAEEFAQWWVGDRTASRVKGLCAALRAVGLPTSDAEA